MVADGVEWQRTPGAGRYARPEIERRFLVPRPPPLDAGRLIEDRYLDGTRLRLRRISAAGAPPVHKLTQKVRPDPADPAVVRVTNVYLDAGEWARLAVLPAATLVKTRHALAAGGRTLAVDVFAGALAGLVLAELEVADLAEPVPRPAWLGREVTRDERFSGGALAALAAGALPALLA